MSEKGKCCNAIANFKNNPLSIYEKNANGYSMLHHAAYLCHAECIDFLIKNGIDATIKDSMNRSPLLMLIAGSYGKEIPIDCVKLLIDGGADIHKSIGDRSSYSFLASNQKEEIDKYLLDKELLDIKEPSED